MTIGEIITKALLDTLLGMGSVFCVLILISLVIACFKFIPQEKPAAAAPKAQPKAAPAPVKEEDDLALIAVITAAISAYRRQQFPEEPEADYVVRSIKRRK